MLDCFYWVTTIVGYQSIDITTGYKFFTAWLRTGAAANACNGAIYIQKIDAEGSYGQEYIYYGKNASDTFGPGWYVGSREADGSNLVTNDAVTFAPGEGWIMYSGKAAKLVIPSAVKE